MRLKRISNEVSFADEKIVRVGRSEVETLKQALAGSTRGRSRICAHKNSDDLLHEMMIALEQRTYIRPHKHFGKSESFHIIEGEVDVVVFDDIGNLFDVIQLGDFRSSRDFFYRLAEPLFHTLLIRSKLLVLHETTNGPFKREETRFAPWSPEENDVREVEIFMRSVADSVARFFLGKPSNFLRCDNTK